jgi:hypothetical protein
MSILPVDTRVRCKLTNKLGYTVNPPAPDGFERVWWEDYPTAFPVLQWTSLLTWTPTAETGYIGSIGVPQ